MHRPSLAASLPQQSSMPLPISRAPLHQDSVSQSPVGTVGNIAPVRSPAVGTPLQMAVPTTIPVQPYQAQAVPSPAPYYQPLQARTTPYATPSAHPSTYQSTPVQQPVAAAVPSPQPYSQTAAQPSPYTANRYPAPTPAPAPTSTPAAPVYNPNAPRPIEVFHLSDTANAAIPAEVRSEFHCDDHGRVLFFSTPPMDMVSSATVAKKQLSHSLKYLAAKAEREKRRKRLHEQQEQDTMSIDVNDQQPKRARLDTGTEETIDPSRLTKLISKTVSLLAKTITTGTTTFYNTIYTNPQTAAEYAEADTRQREQDAKAYALAQKASEELKNASVDEFPSRAMDLRRAGIYLEDDN